MTRGKEQGIIAKRRSRGRICSEANVLDQFPRRLDGSLS